MRYFGGGIGHLKNTPPQQVPGFDPIDPTSEEMAMEELEDEDLGTVVQQPSSDVMNGRELVHLEVNESDEDKDDDDDDDDSDSDIDEGGDQTDEDEDEELEGEGEDDYGYASA